MYGLKNDKQNPEKFTFDLQKEMKEKPTRGKEILDKAQVQIQDIKNQLAKGASEKEYDQLNVLLYGYTALQKVIKKAMK
jgi:hypothetical protein